MFQVNPLFNDFLFYGEALELFNIQNFWDFKKITNKYFFCLLKEKTLKSYRRILFNSAL